MSKLSVSQ